MNLIPDCESSALTHGFYHSPTVPGSDRRAQPGSERQHMSDSLSSSAGWTPASPDARISRPRSPYSLYAKSFLGLRWSSSGGGGVASRRKREFTPDEQKDSTYWVKRKRNNEAARRSRQRRRMDELLLEKRAVELLRENEKLKATLSAVHFRCVDHVGSGAPVAAELCSTQGFATPTFHPPSGALWHCQPPATFPAAAPSSSWMPPRATFHDPFAGYRESTRSPGISVLDAFCALPVSSVPRALSGAAPVPGGPVDARSSPSVPPTAPEAPRGAWYPCATAAPPNVAESASRARNHYTDTLGAQCDVLRSEERNGCDRALRDAQSVHEEAPPRGHGAVAQNPQGAPRFVIDPEPPREKNAIRPHGFGPEANSSLESAENKAEAEAVLPETDPSLETSLPYKLRFKASGCKRYEHFHLTASASGKNFAARGGTETKPNSPGPKRDGGNAAREGRP